MESVYFTDLPKHVQKNIEVLLEERTFSFSRLSLIADCMFRYFLKYVERVKESDDVEPLAFGKAVHKAIEEKINGADDKSALVSGWKEVDFFPFNLVEYERIFRDSHVQQGEGLDGVGETEIHFKLPLEEKTDTAYVQGFIDYLRNVFGSYDFIDWKTNRVPYNPIDTFQLPLYAWAISILKNVDIVRGSLHFLRYYKQRVRSKTYTKVEMEEARLWATQIANKTLNSLRDLKEGKTSVAESFPPSLNEHCLHCPFADICVSTYETIKK